MKIRLPFLLLIAFALSATLVKAQHPAPRVVHIEELRNRIDSKNDTIYVVNFWATWCKPCVAELPHFEELQAAHAAEKVKVLLVSIDFASDFEKRLVPFVKKKGLACEVLLLDEPDYNSWIGGIHPDWSGALPATLIVQNSSGKTAFKEASFTAEELQLFYQNFISDTP
jgi:thiol-disulfide isomerase/thioredoxin